MTAWLAPLAFALALWWVATGVIVYLDGLGRRTHRWTMLGATAVGVGGLVLVGETSRVATPLAAYAAFAAAIAVWAWIEVAFLLGYVTGPRRVACPPDAGGWRRAVLAFRTVAHHEAALLAALVAVVALSAGGANATASWTFVVLYAMRQSAKLNLFLGVRNLSEAFLPPELRYFATYFRRRRLNALWPLSVALACAAAWPFIDSAAADPFHAASHGLVVALLALGVVEHLLLVVPLPPERLWRWSLASHARRAAADTHA